MASPKRLAICGASSHTAWEERGEIHRQKSTFPFDGQSSMEFGLEAHRIKLRLP